jgi:hypothetical protein
MRTPLRNSVAAAMSALFVAIGLTPALPDERRDRHQYRPPPRLSLDTVGSIAYDRTNDFGYNRITGERYYKCMFDEGYGRVRPCDAAGDR